MTKGVDRCLFAFPPEEWASFKANIKANADLSARGRQLSRMFFSMAFEATLDRQGRVLIPTKLARYAGLTKDVTITGVDDRLEIFRQFVEIYRAGVCDDFRPLPVEKRIGRKAGQRRVFFVNP